MFDWLKKVHEFIFGVAPTDKPVVQSKSKEEKVAKKKAATDKIVNKITAKPAKKPAAKKATKKAAKKVK